MFLDQTEETVRCELYVVRKIERVKDALIDACSRLAMAEFSAEVVAT